MKIKKLGALLVSAALCAGMAAPAFAFEGEAAPVEQPVLPEVVEEDVVTVTDETSGALTPEGNLTLVDDYHTNYSDGSGQQFITLVSKSGNTFYLVIDRNAKGQQTVHFMNLVDEADLLALMEEEAADAYTAEKEAAAQAELDRLKAEEEAKKAEEEAATAEPPKENKITKYAGAFLGICAKAQMLIHSAVPPLPHKIIFDAFPGTPLCEIAVLQTARFHPKENCIFLALLCSYPFAAPA